MPVLVRPATAADVPAIRAIYAPVVEGTATSFEETVPSVEEMAARMAAVPRLPWLVADIDGEVAGYAYATRHRARAAYRWSAESSVYLHADYRARGIGRQLYEHLITDVRDLGYVSMFAGIALPNEASVGLHESLGFVPVGVFRTIGYKQGSWWDVSWWHRLLVEPDFPPPEPREWVPEPAPRG